MKSRGCNACGILLFCRQESSIGFLFCQVAVAQSSGGVQRTFTCHRTKNSSDIELVAILRVCHHADEGPRTHRAPVAEEPPAFQEAVEEEPRSQLKPRPRKKQPRSNAIPCASHCAATLQSDQPLQDHASFTRAMRESLPSPREFGWPL